MNSESKIRLLINKSYAYKFGYKRSVSEGDAEAAEKWKEGYQTIKDKISELRES